MSTDFSETEEFTKKRATLSLQDRVKVIDYLRSQPEPIVADSNNAIAAIVSEATKVTISFAQLKYMFEELSEMNLGAKVYVKSPLSADDRSGAFESRIASLQADIVSIASGVSELTDIISKLNDRIEALENKSTED
jgi:prefoldin subunit 5